MSINGLLQVMISKNNHWDFQSAIQSILNGRDPYPWGEAIGLSHSQINNMTKKGIIPKGVTVGLICETERASGTWLTTGRGPHFDVCHYDQESAQKWLADFIEYNQGANIYMVAGEGGSAIITSMLVEKEPADGEAYNYTEINVLHLLNRQGMAPMDHAGVNTYSLDLSAANFQGLVQGNMGNQAILRLVENAEPFRPALQLAEATKAYGTPDTETEHTILIEQYERLDPPLKKAVWAILGLKSPQLYPSLSELGLGDEVNKGE